jgi:hypothetical protein
MNAMPSRTVTYCFFFSVETIGILLIFWVGIPQFRHLIRFEQGISLQDEITLMTGTVLILAPYWTWLRQDPPFELPRQPFLGHIFLFLNRLIFIFASGIFSFVVYRYSDQFDLTILKVCQIMTVLFAIFCFSRHLERLGLLLLDGYRPAPRKTV